MLFERLTAIFMRAFVSRDLGLRDPVIDAMRGLSVAAMILVNHTPLGPPAYFFLMHAEWHGWTLPDTIAPAFLFIVGVSIHLSSAGRPAMTAGAPAQALGKILRRSLLLLAIGSVITNFPYYSLPSFYIGSVLGHIGLCYLLAATARLFLSRRQLGALCVSLLLVQWACYALIEVPGSVRGALLPQANASTYLNELVFGEFARHLGGSFQESLLVLAGGVATTLIGVLVGALLTSRHPSSRSCPELFAVGLLLTWLGLVFDIALPINKSLWTASYVVFMAGVAMQTLALLYWLSERALLPRAFHALRIIGINALFVFVFAQLVQRILVYGRVPAADGSTIRLRVLLFDELIAPWANNEFGSLVFVVVYLAVCFGVALFLYRRHLVIKL